ncbi:MAG: ATP-binding protein [Nanoarchaeota archaeon]|nr:ATP-binding protein [Nanoarchaeota archaeon]
MKTKRKIIGITGGKGGTGKSTVATALAVELAKKGRVLLADMDVECPNDHLILNIERKEISQVFQRIPKIDNDRCSKCGKCGKACVNKAIVSVSGKFPFFMPAQCNGCGACKIVCIDDAISWGQKEIGTIFEGNNHNIDYISGELKINEPVSEFIVDEIKKRIEKIKQDYDFILLDTAAGTHCDVISSLKYIDLALAVTEPTPLGEHDLELIIKLLMRLKKPFEIILNRSEKENESLIVPMVERYNKKIFAKVPYKKEIMEQYSRGEPVEDDSIKTIAEEIEKW